MEPKSSRITGLIEPGIIYDTSKIFFFPASTRFSFVLLFFASRHNLRGAWNETPEYLDVDILIDTTWPRWKLNTFWIWCIWLIVHFIIGASYHHTSFTEFYSFQRYVQNDLCKKLKYFEFYFIFFIHQHFYLTLSCLGASFRNLFLNRQRRNEL